jgi:hypothetical protein
MRYKRVRRERAVMLRLTEKEFAYLGRYARREGTAVGTYAREIVMDHVNGRIQEEATNGKHAADNRGLTTVGSGGENTA